MSDGENKQEFQIGQLEEEHNEDGNGNASDSHVTGSPVPSPVISKPTLYASPLCKVASCEDILHYQALYRPDRKASFYEAYRQLHLAADVLKESTSNPEPLKPNSRFTDSSLEPADLDHNPMLVDATLITNMETILVKLPN